MDTEFKVISGDKEIYEGVEVHVTGFGKFGSVETNPTSVLVGSLDKLLAEHPIPKLKLGSAQIVKVSCVEALKTVNELVKTASEKQKANPKTKQIIIHFGVATKNQLFYVESKAYNGADFVNF